ncbi:MAG: DMT family transporter [Bacteroidales bacterium]
MNKKLEGHFAMFVSKSFSGLNANALKFLVPVWMTPLAGVTFRVLFGAVAFWVVDLFLRKKRESPDKLAGDSAPAVENRKLGMKEIVPLLLIGMFGFYVFQIAYLTAVQYTTPVSVSILGSLMPVWTFVIGMVIYKTEHFAWNKIVGLTISVGGAVLSVFAKKPHEMAANPVLGDSLAILSSIAYAFYLLYSKKLLERVDSITMLKWSFTGAAFAAVVVDSVLTWGPFHTASLLHAPVLDSTIHWVPLLVLLFVLLFPTVLSFFLLQIGLKYLPATVVASYNNVLIVVATITSLILGQDVFSWLQTGAIALLFVGLYFISKPEPSAIEPMR